ncbi:MAG: response regulator [Rhodospirillales bacterium]
MLANLLSNAAKFSPEGETIEISLRRNGNNFRVSVSDQGAGVPEEFRANIFERFTQADSSNVRQQGGTGLGLNISRAIIEKHGGIIDFESEPGNGASFYFDLVEYGKNRITAPEPAADAADGPAAQPKILNGLHILVLEDEPDVAEFICILLQQYGARCDVAHDAEEARAAIAKTKYQAITLDMLLPSESGVSFLQELRANDATKDIPVVVVSAIANDSREEVLTSVLGVMDWLQKPIDEHRLIRAIKRGTEIGASGQSKILIVEDDADLNEVLVNMIGDMAEVSVAANMAQARRQLELTRWSLVILDVALPDGSGLDLIPFLKNQGNLPTPVIIYSAEEVSSDIAAKVEHALVKTQTSNDDLLNMIEAMVTKPGAVAQ